MHVVQSVGSRKYLVSRGLVDEARTTLARVPVVIAEMVEARIRNGAPHARLVDRNADVEYRASRGASSPGHEPRTLLQRVRNADRALVRMRRQAANRLSRNRSHHRMKGCDRVHPLELPVYAGGRL